MTKQSTGWRGSDGWIYTSMGKTSSVLDFGGVSPQYTSVAAHVVACDPALLEKGRLAFADESFDLVFLNQKISAVNFQHGLREISRILKPGGQLCLTAKNRLFSPWDGFAHTLAGISSSLKSAGFNVEQQLAPLPDPEHLLYILDIANPEAFDYLTDFLSQRLAKEISPFRRLLMVFARGISRLGIQKLSIAKHFYPFYFMIAEKRTSYVS